MLQSLVAFNLVTPPAIWGKLPAHANFIADRVRPGEDAALQAWLAGGGPAHLAGPRDASEPVTFVLPPGTLPFAPRRFVMGVLAPSCDSLGVPHPLLVYQRAHPRWVARHLTSLASGPEAWLIWLGRALSRHLEFDEAADLFAVRRGVHALWSLFKPDWTQLCAGRPGNWPRRDELEAWAAESEKMGLY